MVVLQTYWRNGINSVKLGNTNVNLIGRKEYPSKINVVFRTIKKSRWYQSKGLLGEYVVGFRALICLIYSIYKFYLTI